MAVVSGLAVGLFGIPAVAHTDGCVNGTVSRGELIGAAQTW